MQDQPDAKLARGIIRDTFFKSEVSGDLDYNLQWVQIHSNWQVMGVESVLNKPLYTMHKAFGDAYKIEDTRVHYHGSDMAELIAKVGYRGSACVRRKYGVGIYSSPDPWEALSYANGDAANKSEFVVKMLITSVHIGPYTGGWQDRMDYGVDANGKQIYSPSRPGEPADPEEAIQIMVEAHPYKANFLKGANANGGGAEGGHKGGVLPKAGKLDGNPAERTEYFAAKYPELK
jgi:hypothetical protein